MSKINTLSNASIAALRADHQRLNSMPVSRRGRTIEKRFDTPESMEIKFVSIEKLIDTFGDFESRKGGIVYEVILHDSYLTGYTDKGKKYDWPPLDDEGNEPENLYDLFVIPYSLLIEPQKRYPIGRTIAAVCVPYILPERMFKKNLFDEPPENGECSVWIPSDFSFFSGLINWY